MVDVSINIVSLIVSPLIDLRPSNFANLNSLAVSFWLSRTKVDDWGASMYLHGPTRAVYRSLGLDIVADNALALPATDPKWQLLIECLRENTLSTSERLYWVRLLLYLGFYANALAYLAEMDLSTLTPAERFWRTYLKCVAHQMNNPRQWPIDQLVKSVSGLTESFPIEKFHGCIRLAAHYMRVNHNAALSRYYLELAQDTANNSFTGSIKRLALARVCRHRSCYALLLKQDRKHLSLLEKGAEYLSCKKNYLRCSGNTEDFLHRETLRRLLSFGALAAIDRGDLSTARRYAQKAHTLDPYCASTSMHLGEIARKQGNNQVATTHFQRARLIGLLEKPYSSFMELKLKEPKTVCDWDVIRSLSENLFNENEPPHYAQRVIAKSQEIKTAPLLHIWLRKLTSQKRRYSAKTMQFPVSIGTCNRLYTNLKAQDPSLKNRIVKSEVYQRLSAYWTLQEPPKKFRLPYWARQPANAWRVYRQQQDPFYQSVYFQSTHVDEVRERIILDAVGGPFERKSHQPVFGETLETLRGASESMDRLLHDVATLKKNRESLKRHYLARVIGYLGFVDEALNLSRIPWDKKKWSAEDALLAYTNLFFQYAGQRFQNYKRESEEVFKRIPETSDTLRIRITLCIQCGGYCGKTRDIKSVDSWRRQGEKILQQINRSNRFSAEELGLLNSRWWRFASFLPFLTGKRSQLIAETQRYEKLAREFAYTNERTTENMYAALETKARIEEFLGNPLRALEAFNELATRVDPYDAKVWINIGDLKEKLSDHRGAIAAFTWAARLGPPLREIAWYRAGLNHTVLKEYDQALACQINSLTSYPLGKSPLFEITSLAKRLNLPLFSQWGMRLLENFNKLTLSQETHAEIVQAMETPGISLYGKSEVNMMRDLAREVSKIRKDFEKRKTRSFSLDGDFARMFSRKIGVRASTLIDRAFRGQARIRAEGKENGKFRTWQVTDPSHAHTLYAQGATIFIDEIEGFLPFLKVLERFLAQEFGLHSGLMNTKLSLSLPGSGFPMHFDRWDTLQLQLKGSKKWFLAKNNYVIDPIDGLSYDYEAAPRLLSYSRSGIERGPTKKLTVNLRTNKMLFVPRGWWHETSAVTESATLIILFKIPSRLHLLPENLKTGLELDRRWRAGIINGWSTDPVKRDRCDRDFQKLIDETFGRAFLDARSLIDGFDIANFLQKYGLKRSYPLTQGL